MLAVPPIQLPDSAAKPVQASAGRKRPKSRSEIGPPTTIPTVPATTMIRATGPSRAMLLTSIEIMRRRSAKSSR